MKHLAWFLSAYLLLICPVAAASNAVSDNYAELTKADFFVEGLAPVRKSGPYDLTIVYFLDYQCSACRQYTLDVAQALNEDRRIRVIYRDIPLLGPRSDEAARAAIASSFQGRHEPFHLALMTTKGPLDATAIKAAAQKAGINWSRLQRDIISRSEDIDLLIGRNVELATIVGILGTPAFIVGERQSNGALDHQSLKLEIADARKEAGATGVGHDPVMEATSESVTVIKPKSGPTPVNTVVKKRTNANTAIFDEQIEGREGSSIESPEGSTWKWLVAAVIAGIGLATIGARARAQRRVRNTRN